MADNELELFIDNDADLYEKHRKPIYAKLAEAKLAGKYSHAAAVKEFIALATVGAKKYQREVQARYFTSDEKKEYAESAAKYFETEWDLGNMHGYASGATKWNPSSIPMLGQATSNPCGAHRNPYEVRSASGLEGVFADEDEAKFYADEIRGAGAVNVSVDRREAATRPRPPRHAIGNPSSRLFSGVYPTGIVYADKQQEVDGDYARVAFLPFSTLELEWSPGSHPIELVKAIQDDAAKIVARRGLEYPVSASGQTVTLGSKRNPPFTLPVPGQQIRAWDYGIGKLVTLCEESNDGSYTAHIKLANGRAVSVPLTRTEYDLTPRKNLERRTGFSRHEQYIGPPQPERMPRGTPMGFEDDDTVIPSGNPGLKKRRRR